MALGGSNRGLLDDFHASGCEGREFSTCRPIVLEQSLVVVRMVWCEDCGAAAWEEV